MLPATTNKLLRRVVALSGWVYLSTDDAPKEGQRDTDLAWADEEHRGLNRTRVSLLAGKETIKPPKEPDAEALKRFDEASSSFNEALYQLVMEFQGRVWIPEGATEFLSALWGKRHSSVDNQSVITFERIPVSLVHPGSPDVPTITLQPNKKVRPDHAIY